METDSSPPSPPLSSPSVVFATVTPHGRKKQKRNRNPPQTPPQFLWSARVLGHSGALDILLGLAGDSGFNALTTISSWTGFKWFLAGDVVLLTHLFAGSRPLRIRGAPVHGALSGVGPHCEGRAGLPDPTGSWSQASECGARGIGAPFTTYPSRPLTSVGSAALLTWSVSPHLAWDCDVKVSSSFRSD